MDNNELKIIVIDDEDAIRRMFEFFFQDCGCYIKTAENGKQGLQILTSEGFHAAIVDIRMPDMIGTDFILKAYEIRPETKYFIHTGLIYYNIPKELSDIGINEDFIIHKPVLDMYDIFKAIIKQTYK